MRSVKSGSKGPVCTDIQARVLGSMTSRWDPQSVSSGQASTLRPSPSLGTGYCGSPSSSSVLAMLAGAPLAAEQVAHGGAHAQCATTTTPPHDDNYTSPLGL